MFCTVLNAWIDINPRKIGATIWGLPVHAPTWLAQQPRPVVLVYVTTHGARDEVAAALQHWGYQAGVDFLPVG